MKSETMDADALSVEASVAPRDSDASRAGARLLTNFCLFFVATLAFILPNAIFASALRPLPGAMVLAGCVGAGAMIWRAKKKNNKPD
jgi:hypothetical protein